MPHLPNALRKQTKGTLVVRGVITVAVVMSAAASWVLVCIFGFYVTEAERGQREAAYASYITAADAYQDYKHRQLMTGKCIPREEVGDPRGYAGPAEEAALYRELQAAYVRVEFALGSDGDLEEIAKLYGAADSYEGYVSRAVVEVGGIVVDGGEGGVCPSSFNEEIQMLSAYEEAREDLVRTARENIDAELPFVSPFVWP